jgi:hypothetical protein
LENRFTNLGKPYTPQTLASRMVNKLSGVLIAVNFSLQEEITNFWKLYPRKIQAVRRH